MCAEKLEICASLRFPRGLEQPEDSLRFGADALLLAAFAARHVEGRNTTSPQSSFAVAELGCGCGAALLGLALRCPEVCGLGMDKEDALVLAAQRNAGLMGLEGKLRFVTLDLANQALLRAVKHPCPTNGASALAANRLDAVLANPPYEVAGRSSPHRLRECAMRGCQTDSLPHGTAKGRAGENETVLSVFCRAAATLLRHQGHFFCIYDARALPQLCAALSAAKLGLRRLLPIHSRTGQPALRVLVEARKNAAHEVVLEAPLYLHRKSDNANAGLSRNSLWTARALRFCPWLA